MNELKNGRECVQDANRAGRTVTAMDSYKTDQLERLLKSDRRITCEEMDQELEISVRSVHIILRNHLKMRKVPARWVPHRLTSDQANVVLKWPLTFHSLIWKDKTFYQKLLQLTKRG